MLNVKKCMCWYSSIIELKNARWNIEKQKKNTVVFDGVIINRLLNYFLLKQFREKNLWLQH